MDPITLSSLAAVAGIDAALLLAIRIGRSIRNSPKRRLRRRANSAKRAIENASREYEMEAKRLLRMQRKRNRH